MDVPKNQSRNQKAYSKWYNYKEAGDVDDDFVG